MLKWYKLDNAAKVFPAVSKPDRTNIFRMTFELHEDIEPTIMQQALEIVIKRFPTLNVKIKKGFFWYYFETNNLIPKLQEESPYLCRIFQGPRDNNGFLFRVVYFKKRISIEMFHSLTDGTGTMEFLKSLVLVYLNLKGANLTSENILTGEVEISNEELQDSFLAHYNTKLKQYSKEPHALQYKAEKYQDNWIGSVTGIMNLEDLRKLTKSYDATITEFIGALIIYSAAKNRHLFEDKDKPFTLFIPVNLRKIFPSKTLRNFSLYIRTSAQLGDDSFLDILENVKRDAKEEITKEKLQARFTQTVKFEKNLALRIAPRLIKEIALRIGFKMMADRVNTSSYSNLGIIEVPLAMKKYINKAIFSIGASRQTPLNISSLSFADNFIITFDTYIKDRSLQREFFRFLTSKGIKVTIENNELEVY